MRLREAPVLNTERLLLRPYVIADFGAFSRYFASTRSRFTDGPVSPSHSWTLIAAGAVSWRLEGHGPWTITRAGEDNGIGLVSLNKAIELPTPDLGWILWEGFEGKGYALEAARAARDFAFTELGWSELLSGIHQANSASIRLAERMGARHDPSLSVASEPETQVYRHGRGE